MALPQGFGPRRSFADVQRQQLANQLLAQGGDASPVAHPMQGVARLAQALMGGYLTNRNETRENEQQQAFSQAVTEAMQPQFVPGAAGPGPRSGPEGATMAPPSFGQVAQNLARRPETAHLAPQFTMMDLQQQAAEAAKRNDPMFGRVAVRGVGLVDMRGNQPQVVVPEQRQNAAPSLVQEFEFAKANGFQGGFMDYQRMRAESTRPQTNVNVTGDTGPRIGTIPPGFQLRQNADGAYVMEPIPGSPAALEAQRLKDTKDEGTRQTAQSGGIVTQDIERAIGLMDRAILPTTGAAGQAISGIGGTAARDVAGLLDTIKANTAFDKLAEMRKASPTGAALGSVTERELALLSAVRGNLEQSQSEQQLRFNLARLNNTVLDIVHGPGQGPARMPLPGQRGQAGPRAAQPPRQPQAPAQGQTPDINFLLDRYAPR